MLGQLRQRIMIGAEIITIAEVSSTNRESMLRDGPVSEGMARDQPAWQSLRKVHRSRQDVADADPSIGVMSTEQLARFTICSATFPLSSRCSQLR